jgi:group I intron endonuclease
MAVIYKATNKVNGKAYIGFDSNWPNRKTGHLYNSKNETDNTSYFHRAIQKHGWENFVWEILKENAALDDEIFLIEKHNTFHTGGRGYNLTKGGDGNLGWVMPEKTKKKISEKAKGNKRCLGRKLSNDTKRKISDAKCKGKPSPLRNRKQTKETITKRVESRTEYKHTKETKEKISLAKTNQMPTENQIRVLRENAQKMKETGHTDEAKQKISASQKGKPKTQEHKRNISLNHAAHKETGAFYQSEEYKQKMSKSLKGKKRTPESIERYRLAAKKREENKRKNKQGF